MTGLRALTLIAAICLAPLAASAQAVPDHVPFGELVTGLDSVEFGPEDIVSVKTGKDHGLSVIYVRLSPRLDNDFARLTKDKFGYAMKILVCGRLVVQATIQVQIKKADFEITSDDAAAEAEFLLHPPCLTM